MSANEPLTPTDGANPSIARFDRSTGWILFQLAVSSVVLGIVFSYLAIRGVDAFFAVEFVVLVLTHISLAYYLLARVNIGIEFHGSATMSFKTFTRSRLRRLRDLRRIEGKTTSTAGLLSCRRCVHQVIFSFTSSGESFTSSGEKEDRSTIGLEVAQKAEMDELVAAIEAARPALDSRSYHDWSSTLT